MFLSDGLKTYIISILGPQLSKHPPGPGASHLQLEEDFKELKGGAQYVAEVRLLTQSSLQASAAAYLPLTATTEKFAAIQLAPDSGSRRVNDLKVVFRNLTIFQATNKNLYCDCFKAFTKHPTPVIDLPRQ